MNENEWAQTSTISPSINTHHRNKSHSQMDPPFLTSQAPSKAQSYFWFLEKPGSYFLGLQNTLKAWSEHSSTCVQTSSYQRFAGEQRLAVGWIEAGFGDSCFKPFFLFWSIPIVFYKSREWEKEEEWWKWGHLTSQTIVSIGLIDGQILCQTI